MNKFLVENNYLIVPGLINKKRAANLAAHFGDGYGDNDGQCPNAPHVYNNMPYLELLCELTPDISYCVGETVLPTYCYARQYRKGAVLAPHSDRPACDLSLTLNLSCDKPWRIWIRRPDGSKASALLTPGDAMIYLGCIAEHWRTKFTGNECTQVFLHYVRSRGENSWAYFDKAQQKPNAPRPKRPWE